MDTYHELRALPLQAIIFWLGERTDWKQRKDGLEFTGPCPICKPKRNKGNFSFHVDGRFRCFSCPAKGRGCIDFVMQYRQVGFQEAVDQLKDFNLQTNWADKAATIPAIKHLQVSHVEAQVLSDGKNSLTDNPPFKGSYEKYYVPSEWLAKRGFSPETLATFGVGQYDNPKRQSAYKGKILLPVRRWKDGELVAYLARTPEPKDGEPKYIWPKGFQKSLEVFGAWQIKTPPDGGARQLPLRVCYLVESPFSVLKFHQLGFQAVSCFGWSVSDQQLDILASLAKGLCYLPDRNVYAQAEEQAGRLSRRLWVRFPELPNGIHDPEQLTAEQVRALT